MEAIDYAGLLDPAHLPDEQAIKSSLQIVEQHLTEENCIAVVEEILSIANPQSTAIFLSGLSSGIPVERWILNNITFDMGYHLGSTASHLLSSLSNFFMFNSVFMERRELAMELVKYSREVQSALSAIPALTPFYSRRSPVPLLAELGIPLPTNSSEAKRVLSQIIERQKHILSRYLDVIRIPKIRSEIMAGFIDETNRAHVTNASKIPAVPRQSDENQTTNMQFHEWKCAAPILKQSLEAVNSFGEWKILISGRADNDLREWRRRDRKVFLIILKKIRDLSNGDFSPNNQRRVNRSGNDVVPIFEAKAIFNCRLIYQVDCLQETEAEEKQALKIFGIYSPTELDTELWNVVGKQLVSLRGKEYRNRCTYRVPLNLDSDRRHFIPAVFPPIAQIEKSNERFSIADLLQNVQDDEVQTILVLQKFIPFSQPLLYSIFADLEAIFPFEVSLEEKLIIEHPASCYVLGRSGTGKTTAMLYKMLWIERSFQINSGGSTRARQVFVTKSGVLAEKVQEHFNKMLESLGMSSKTPQELKEIALSRKREESGDLVDKDEDTDLHTTLPGKFSNLQDEHFPLFLTFDRLCALLAADLVGATDINLSRARASQLAYDDPGLQKENFMSFERFLGHHWPHYNQILTKGLDPYSVFNELLGVIEGSELAALSPQRCLDATTYESLSERSNPTFSTKRSIIYEIFQLYRKKKRERGEYDAADRTHSLLRSIEMNGLPGRKFDYIYVDEAQDNLMIDALLLRILCRDPNGLFWAGDTAQTISSGCSFRFQDLKSMLYEMEQQAEKRNPGFDSEPPKTFCLTVNYRSHTGIVNCAHSIVELIQRYWPYSIDALAPERGLIIGPPPVILMEHNLSDTRFKEFLLGSREDSELEFGAHQCIIVHNQEAKRRLRVKVGDIPIILTIYESKGLEFNDVLLYNFFEDSTLGATQWRLVLMLDSGGRDAAKFDPVKHVALCAELKSLYVAITRAKENLWIVDCSEKAKPMRDYWLTRNLVHVRATGEDLPHLAKKSTAKDWADTGKMLFERKQYSQARSCFERASCQRESAIAYAYALREDASRLPSDKPDSSAEVARQNAFVQAAEAFLSCSSEHDLVYFRRSGECFEAAGRYLQAAKAYYRGKNYAESILLYRRLGKFDEAIEIILEKKDKPVPQDVVDDTKNAARLFYFSRAESDSAALRKAKQLFDTVEEALEFLEQRCLDGVRAIILLSLRRYAEAVESFVAAGRWVAAIKVLLMTRSSDSTRRACNYILQEFRKLMSFGFRAENATSNPIVELLDLSNQLEKNHLSSTELAEVEMFHGIYTNHHSVLRKLGEMFFDKQNSSASARCFEQLYKGCLPHFEAMTLPELIESLRTFEMYIWALSALAIGTDPRDSPVASQLFGFRVWNSKGNRFIIPKGTFFYARIEENGFYPSTRVKESLLVSGETLRRVYRNTLEAYLKNLLLQENESCLHSRVLSPCVDFTVQSNCRNKDCSGDHQQLADYDSGWYNQRIHVYLIQISIVQACASLLNPQELNQLQSIWVSGLYEALHPSLYQLGSLAQLNPSLIPNYSRYLHMVKEWIRELVCGRPSYLLRSLDLSLIFDNAASNNHIYHAKFTTSPLILDYLRSPHGTYTVFEAINSLRDENNWLSSLTQGILFSKHVVDKRLPIDMGVLCNYLDFLCGQSIICASTQRYGALHQVLLPKSWWIKLMIWSGCNVKKSIRLSRLLVDVISSLLSQLLASNEAEHLQYHSQAVKLESQQAIICWIYITRLCRAICLLGHNLEEHRQSILNMFGSLSSLVDDASPLCNMYLQSHRWSDIVVALHAGSYSLAREQLILVCHQEKATSAHACQEQYYQQLHYTDKPHLLAALHQSWPRSRGQEMAPQVWENIVNDVIEAKHDPELLNQELTDENQLHDVEEEPQEFSQETLPMQTATFTDEEQTIIQNACRRYFQRKATSMNSSEARLTRGKFMECLEQSQAFEWPRRSRYRLLYLGPLPNLLACLETVHADITDKKSNARNMWRNGLEPEKIDWASAALTELSSHNKEIRRLKEALGPKGNIHQSRNHAALRSTVQEAVTFIRRFPNVAIGEMRWDLEAAEKGILKERMSELAYYDDLY